MIYGFKLTATQAGKLLGKQMSDDVFYNPIKDKDGVYFIFGQEKSEAEILLNTTLMESEYVPITPPTR